MAVINESLYMGYKSDRKLFKYDLGSLTQSDLVASPISWTDSKAIWDGGTKIYVAGDGSASSHCSVYPYDIIDNSFGSELSNDGFNSATGGGFVFCMDDWKNIYLGIGASSTTYGFDMATQVWNTASIASFTSYGSYGSAMTMIPISATYKPGYVCYAKGQGNASFYMIDPLNDVSWTSKASLPAADFVCGMVWVGEYVYTLGYYKKLYRYDVNANTWSTMTDIVSDYYSFYGGILASDGDPNGFLYAFNKADAKIYAYDIDGDSWSTVVDLAGSLLSNYSWMVHVPQIRFDYLDSDDSTRLTDPFAINNAVPGTAGTEVKRYLKALEAVGTTVTIQVISDSRTDADAILELAPDSGGSPGSWGSSANMGTFTADQSKAFWLRANPAAGTGLGMKQCKIEVSVA